MFLSNNSSISFVVSGSGGQLRPGDLRKTPLTDAGFDADQTFMLNEVVGDDLHFQVVTRTGKTVDAGTLHRKARPITTE